MAKPKLSFDDPVVLLATGGGVGLLPAPGTMGSLLATALAIIAGATIGNAWLLPLSLIVFFGGWKVSSLYIARFGGEDPQEVVIDEIAGQWLLLSFLPEKLPSYVIGFILFRLFDIIKPWPIRKFEREIKGGFGVMFDDMLAAIYPVILALFLFFLTFPFGLDLTPIIGWLL